MNTNHYSYSDNDTTIFGADEGFDSMPVDQWELADFEDLVGFDAV